MQACCLGARREWLEWNRRSSLYCKSREIAEGSEAGERAGTALHQVFRGVLSIFGPRSAASSFQGVILGHGWRPVFKIFPLVFCRELPERGWNPRSPGYDNPGLNAPLLTAAPLQEKEIRGAAADEGSCRARGTKEVGRVAAGQATSAMKARFSLRSGMAA